MKHLLLVLCLLAGSAWAQDRMAAPAAADPALEARVMVIAEELRCLVCQNETIAASHAELAVDLRGQIREQLRAGRTQEDILAFMSQRYGDFVLYNPPLKPGTVLLWLGPFVLLGLGGVALVRHLRRRRVPDTYALSPADMQRAQRLLDEAGGHS